MKARPVRCSNGPQSRTGIRLEPACAATATTSAFSTALGSSTSSPGSAPGVTWTPWSSSSSETMATSAMSGMLRSRLGVVPSNAATMAFGTRFFAPRTVSSPTSGVPPWTWRTSQSRALLSSNPVRRVGQGGRVACRVGAVVKRMVLTPCIQGDGASRDSDDASAVKFPRRREFYARRFVACRCTCSDGRDRTCSATFEHTRPAQVPRSRSRNSLARAGPSAPSATSTNRPRRGRPRSGSPRSVAGRRPSGPASRFRPARPVRAAAPVWMRSGRSTAATAPASPSVADRRTAPVELVLQQSTSETLGGVGRVDQPLYVDDRHHGLVEHVEAVHRDRAPRSPGRSRRPPGRARR